ncbi:MAG: fumarate hydratase [Dictyoglomus sp.]|nr:fumarate hydratase [Dictyoglomus sp.]MDW8188158.1 fumarate hydratase [Dictyoglomus sp.]
MRIVKGEEIYKLVKKLIEDANFELPSDVLTALMRAKELEENINARIALDILIENAKIAKEKRIPICQDCGMVVIFIEKGEEVFIDGPIEEFLNKAVSEAYLDNYLRSSVVKDPLLRENTKDNTPPIIHWNCVPGKKIRISVMIKGFGSENASTVKMLNPTLSKDEIISEVVDHVKEYGPNTCPPLIVGLGIGGTMEKAIYLSKKAILRPIYSRNKKSHLRELEEELLYKVNALNIGPGGLGGKTTALDVHIEEYPTHIAGLPLAINLQCYAVRFKEIEI